MIRLLLLIVPLTGLSAAPLVRPVVAEDTPQAEKKDEAGDEAKKKEEEQKKKEREERKAKEEAQKKTIEAVKQLGGDVEIDYTQTDVHPRPVVRVRVNRAAGRLHAKSFAEQYFLEVGFVPTGCESLILDANSCSVLTF